jgi:hypothetical protein
MINFGEKADTNQAVTDTAMKYGLVTDYTSMLIVRDEMFDAYGINGPINNVQISSRTSGSSGHPVRPYLTAQTRTIRCSVSHAQVITRVVVHWIFGC